MNPPEAFGVVVRTIGLCILLYTVPAFLWDVYISSTRSVGAGMFWIIVGTGLMALVGLWMLRGAAAFVAFAYPPPKRYPRDQQEFVDWLTSDKTP